MTTPEKPEPTVDPLIEEVRAARRALAERFNGDLDRLCDHLEELERRHPERVLRPSEVRTPRIPRT